MKLAAILGLLFLANEIRGAIMAGPVLWAIWETGGTLVQWIVLAGIALSVIVPVLVWRVIR